VDIPINGEASEDDEINHGDDDLKAASDEDIEGDDLDEHLDG